MSEMVQDPNDPSRFLIGNAAVGEFGTQVQNVVIERVHDASLCSGRPCVMHNPSEHHMRDWRLNWRDDRGMMERLCPHGVGHPDPDDAAYQRSMDRAWMMVHGCDGCCRVSEETVQ